MSLSKIFKRNSEILLPYCFTLGGLFFACSFFDIVMQIKPVMWISAVLVVIAHIIYIFRYNKRTYISIAAALVLGAGYVFFTRKNIDIYIGFASKYAITLIIIPLYFILRSYKARIVLAVASLGALVAAAFTENILYPLGPMMLILFLVGVFTETVLRIRYRKKEYPDDKYTGFVSYMIVIFAVCAILPGVLRAGTKPLDWSWVRRAWESLEDTGEKIISSLEDRLADGIEEDFELPVYTGAVSEAQGYITDSENDQIHINSRQRMYKNIFLAADYKNEYTGTSFTNTAKTEDYLVGYTDSQLDYFELLFALYRTGAFEKDVNDNYNAMNLIRNRKLAVTYVGFRGKNVFHTGKTWKFSMNDHGTDGVSYAGQTGKVTLLKNPKKRYTYDISYFDLNMGSPAFRAFINDATDDNYSYDAELATGSADYNKIGRDWKMGIIDMEWRIPENLLELLNARRSDIYDKYLDLPSELPERVYELANEVIVTNEKSEYDKLLAVEKYLRDNYSEESGLAGYSGSDLVDNYLFEKTGGTAYERAAAFVVLSRCLGIPARLCEGFAADMAGTFAEKDYALYGDDTYVWPECYIDTVGWIAFEPSNSKYYGRYLAWELIDLDFGTDKDANDASSTEEIVDTDSVLTEENMPQTGDGASEVENTPIEDKEHFLLYLLAGSMTAFAALALLAGSIVGVRIYLNWSSYESSTDVAKIRLDMSQILALLYDLAYKKEKHETITAYFNKVADMMPERREQLMEVLDNYLRFKYNDALLWPEEIAALHTLRGELLQIEKKKLGFFAYLKMLMYKDK